jgi:arsenate reductase-like glutaredoxin family protein
VNVQVFGFKDDADTRKALRFFSERRVAVHFVDLKERPPSPGELRRFQEKFGAAALIDRESPRFRALGLHVAGDSPERLLNRAVTEPRLLRLPLVRVDHRVTIGHAPEVWSAWLSGAAVPVTKPAARPGKPAPPQGGSHA